MQGSSGVALLGATTNSIIQTKPDNGFVHIDLLLLLRITGCYLLRGGRIALDHIDGLPHHVVFVAITI
jgi:hypothetical protein